MPRNYSVELETEAAIADPNAYMRGIDTGDRIAAEGLGIIGRLRRQDPQSLGRHINMIRTMYSQPFPAAEKQRSLIFGTMTGIEEHQEYIEGAES